MKFTATFLVSLLVAGSTQASSTSSNRLDIARKLSKGENPGNMMEVAETLLGGTTNNPLDRVRNLVEEQKLYAATSQHDHERDLSEGFALLFCEVLTSDAVKEELPPTTTVSCDTDGNGELTLTFEDSSQECDEDHCISDLSLEMMIDLSGLSFDDIDNQDPSPMSMQLCLDLDSGFPNTINGVRFCFGIDAEIEFADGDGNADEPVQIQGCVATSDGSDCGCTICDDGMGVNFDCGNALVVRGCEDIGNIGDITEGGGSSLVTSKLVAEDFEESGATRRLCMISSLLVSVFVAFAV